MNVRNVETWIGNLKQKIRRLNFSGAVTQLNSGNQRLAHTINMLSPGLKRYLDHLTEDLRRWRVFGTINPSSMSVEAFEAAEALAMSEYAIIQQMMAQQAAQAAAQAQTQANAERRRAEAKVANAERRARQANAQRERNAAARRNAERRNREAAEARRAAKEAANEARFAASERERTERSRRKANEAAVTANKAAREAATAAARASNENKAARKASRQANLKSRMNAAKERARQASRARQAGETRELSADQGPLRRVISMRCARCSSRRKISLTHSYSPSKMAVGVPHFLGPRSSTPPLQAIIDGPSIK